MKECNQTINWKVLHQTTKNISRVRTGLGNNGTMSARGECVEHTRREIESRQGNGRLLQIYRGFESIESAFRARFYYIAEESTKILSCRHKNSQFRGQSFKFYYTQFRTHIFVAGLNLLQTFYIPT
jgi:hypothetical protein